MDVKVANLLKEQVTKEFYSAYLYLAFSNYYYEVSLDGFGHWFEVQAREEQQHAMKFLKYLQDNNEKVKLGIIDAPDAEFHDHKEPLDAALKHEKYVTSLINTIYREARQVDDYRTCQFLDWFIAEQGEEEKSTSDLIAKYELYASDPKGLYLLNSELLGRADTTAEAQA